MSQLNKRDLPKELEVEIRGVPWRIKFVTRREMPRDTWGDCDWDHKTIRVRRDLSAKNFLDTMIHEIRHAQHEIAYEAEEFISWTSVEIAEILLQTQRVFVNHGRREKARRK